MFDFSWDRAHPRDLPGVKGDETSYALSQTLPWPGTRRAGLAAGDRAADVLRAGAEGIAWEIEARARLAFARVEAARGLVYRAAVKQEKGEKFTQDASMAKLYASETANFCVDRAMQIHAGYGYIGEFSIIEKLYRDQRITEIYEGTSEIQRLVIAGSLLRE